MSAATAPATSSAPTLPEDQLLELLVQLQKSPPAQAKAILEHQPTIAYALVPLMAKLGVVDLDVLRRVLGGFSGPAVDGGGTAAGASGSNVVLESAAPHLGVPYSTPPPTMSVQPPTMPAYGQVAYAPTPQMPSYGVQNGYQHRQQGAPPLVQAPQPVTPGPSASMMSTMAAFPEDQREMIMSVMQMTPDQIRALPPQEQGIMMQLRSTLGMPVD